MDSTTEKNLTKELKLHAHALGIPEGSTESFVDNTIKSVKRSLKPKTIITSADLTRLVFRELKKYHADLAYVYQNHDTII